MPKGAPPKKLVVEVVDEGSGRAIKRTDKIVVDYVGVNYRTGKEFETTWDQGGPAKFSFGTNELIDGWERGLAGMRVGGRRELIVPPKLAYGTDTLIYVVDLVAIE